MSSDKEAETPRAAGRTNASVASKREPNIIITVILIRGEDSHMLISLHREKEMLTLRVVAQWWNGCFVCRRSQFNHWHLQVGLPETPLLPVSVDSAKLGELMVRLRLRQLPSFILGNDIPFIHPDLTDFNCAEWGRADWPQPQNCVS